MSTTLQRAEAVEHAMSPALDQSPSAHMWPTINWPTRSL